MGRLATCKECLRVDRKMLPMKLHFLFYSLAVSAVMSYFPIMAKNIGISATAVGIIYTICPFASVLTSPLFGWITDKSQRVKHVIIIMIIVETPLFLGTVFVPPLPDDIEFFPADLLCSSNNTYSVTSSKFPSFLPNNRSVTCTLICNECPQSVDNSSNGLLCGEDIKLETDEVYDISYESRKVNNISIKGEWVSPNCHENPNNRCQTICSLDAGSEITRNSEFLSYQYWTLFVLMITSLVLADATISIGDAACYEALEGRINQFGKQRVWLSIGWGIGTMMTGFLLDLTNPNKDEKVNFSYCAYVMLILIVFDVISLSQATLIQSSVSENILKDVCTLFTKPHPVFFAFAVLIIGELSGIQWNYHFWYMESLGASKFLLGLSTAVVCVCVESPFMFISGWIVKRIGRDNTMVLAFLSFAVWFVAISYIHNPWWILLIELSQGPSYGLFYVAMTSYGKIATAPGTEATMQTLLSAIFHGLGIGSGSLLGGLGFDVYGGRTTFRISGYCAVAAAIIYKCLTYFVAGEHTAIFKAKTEIPNTGSDKKMTKQEISSIA